MGGPRTDRGQAYTLEGVLSAMIIMLSLLYGLQVVDVGAISSSTSDRTESLRSQASDLLAVAADNGSLQTAVRCYKNDHPIISGRQATASDPQFEHLLNESLDESLRNYKLYFEYWDNSSGRQRELVSSNATELQVSSPSDQATEVTYTVSLYDNMNTTSGSECTDSGTSLTAASGDFYAEDMQDIAPDSTLYNIVEVRLVVW